VLAATIAACKKADKPITVCGEMAGRPRAVAVLFGMGLRSFSMSPAFVPTIKELISHLTSARAEQIVKQAMRLKTTGQIVRYLAEQVNEIAPDVKLFDTA
jgi:phosphoenolpyruvate-protein phosphotransferase (PTS system enzyme I)